ncbi:inositol hexakisphosphate kinase 2-like [Ruditapes philippinarum]|uniref:inositol hexakisphosphate kinase 2-like n=1 Tax=Ruditapes philippinarum TaxID=129788 RepID=UPI00295AB214|nr:inositol hexakisphosphate kinase 2-like [Ruditapes philippinarum]XP_060557896.1 inositol hexakisphosphate kinase 2-like [Ruditapes philippinarum]XP_060557899.1 inositol hexakisphosphate kinase 2-like [Ruditapes philippinarum]
MTSENTNSNYWSQDETDSGDDVTVIDGPMNEDFVEMELRPYRYMVGGHSYVLEVSRSAVCKNYRQRESLFYKNMPQELRPFTPQYLGEINVIMYTMDGRRQFISNIPRNIVDQCKRLELQRDRTDAWTKSDAIAVSDSDVKKYCTKDDNSSRFCMELEEWSYTCLEKYNRAAGTWEDKQSKKFIVMENLLFGYDCPSIIDIKLGKCPMVDSTMTGSESISDGKNQKLRFRIDGYKKFDMSTGSYVVLHKDTTRYFNTEQVIEEIGNFFHDGRRLRTDVIHRIVNKLDELLLVLGQNNRLTFQAASLLIMFDNSNSLHDKISDNADCLKASYPRNDTCTCFNNVKCNTCNNRRCYKCLKADSFTNHQKRNISDCGNIITNCACVTLKELPESLQKDRHDAKSDVKLIDFLKTDECSHVVKGIDSEVLKLKRILLNIPGNTGL